MIRSNRNSAKTLGPVFLLSVVLALPGQLAASPGPDQGHRRGRGGADPTIAHIDGYLTDEGYRCQTLRDHDGRIYGLVGNLDGLREGDHVRLEGRFTNAAVCRQGVAFDVYKVQAVWADRQHRSTLYDHLRDGPFERYSGSARDRDRRGRDDRYERDRYGRDRYRDDRDRGRYDRYDDRYDDRYERDNSGDRRLVIMRGRLGEVRGGCPTLEGRDGRTYVLEGDLRGYGYGDRVKVTGLVLERSRCGGPGIEVGEIVRD